MTPNRVRKFDFAGLIISAGVLLGAIYLQYIYELAPCALCSIQRGVFFALTIAFFLSFIHRPGNIGRKIYHLLIGLLSLSGIAISSYHLWLQYSLRGKASACGPSIEYLMQNYPIFDAFKLFLSAPGDCTKIDSIILGLSLPGWSLIAYLLLGFIAYNGLTTD